MEAPLKNPRELVARLGVEGAGRLLSIDVPQTLRDLLEASRPAGHTSRHAAGEAIRSVKETFDAVVLWREDRVGSRALLDHVVKRLEPHGALWVVTAMKKVRGPKTPAVHRLELSDLVKGLAEKGLDHDQEVRITAWHVGHRFVRRKTGDGRRRA